jgi:hypothetical protein
MQTDTEIQEKLAARCYPKDRKKPVHIVELTF